MIGLKRILKWMLLWFHRKMVVINFKEIANLAISFTKLKIEKFDIQYTFTLLLKSKHTIQSTAQKYRISNIHIVVLF